VQINRKCKIFSDVHRFRKCLYVVSNHDIAAEKVLFQLKYGDGILLMFSISRFADELCQKHFFLIAHSNVAYFHRRCRYVSSTLWSISVAVVNISNSI